MAGTVTSTSVTFGSVKQVGFHWISSTSGEANSTETSYKFDGKVIGLCTIPITATGAPTDNYDVEVVGGRDSLDVLWGAGADRDTLNTEYVSSSDLGIVASEGLTLNVTNAGNVTAGYVYLWIR